MVILPSGWKSIEVERLWVRGRPARLVARHGAKHASIELGEVMDAMALEPLLGLAERSQHDPYRLESVVILGQPQREVIDTLCDVLK